MIPRHGHLYWNSIAVPQLVKRLGEQKVPCPRVRKTLADPKNLMSWQF
jgi:hypothetical protein